MKPHTLRVRIDDELRKTLERESVRTGAPISELVRRAIAAAFKPTIRKAS